MELCVNPLLLLFLELIPYGVPVANPEPKLPSMLNINSEEELGHFSRKWSLTPMQMCTLMGRQMSIAQPLLELNHPWVSHLPNIGEMASSNAVVICEKVLKDAMGDIATVTTVLEETRKEYSVPKDFDIGKEFEKMNENLIESPFTDDVVVEAMKENRERLIELMEDQQNEERKTEETVQVLPNPTIPQPKQENKSIKMAEQPYAVSTASPTTDKQQTTTNQPSANKPRGPSIAQRLGKIHTI